MKIMDVIRIYDDRSIFMNDSFNSIDQINTPPINIVKDINKEFCVQIEYCTISEKKYILYRFKADKTKETIHSWKLEPGNNYYAFLDTLWGEESLPVEPDHIQFGSMEYPMELDNNLKDHRVKTLSVYTAFDPEAAKGLLREVQNYRRLCMKKKAYFPEVFDEVYQIIYDDRADIVETFKIPLKKHITTKD